MKKTIIKLLALILSTAMLFSTIISTSALETVQTFTGKIISDTDIDLSGIEVKIYSSEPVYDESGKLAYYAETYDRSIYTNSIGVFSFTKPTAYCSYTINVETLPAGYGISKHTQFIVPSRLDDTVTAAPIATAETALDGDSIMVTFADESGNVLYTDYEVIPDNAGAISTGEIGSMTEAESIMTYSALKELDSYTYSGTIVTNGKNFRYSEEYDLSDFSEINKADFLYSKGVISEDEKYEFYVNYNNEQIYSEHQNSKLLSQIDSLTYQTDYSVVFDSDLDVEIKKNNSVVYRFRIFYDSNFLSYIQLNETIKPSCTAIYNYFIESASLLAPTMYTDENGDQYFPIYIVNDGDIGDDLGRTIYIPDSNCIKIVLTTNTALASASNCHTLAHEFMHAITRTYIGAVSIEKWFLESLACMAAIVFLENTATNTRSQIRFYKQNCDISIFTGEEYYKDISYGAVLYPLYIYTEMGGWSTIRQILDNCTNNPYLAISSASNVPSYSYAFAAMAAYNYNTGKYYEDYGGDSWGYVKEYERHLVNSFNNSVNPMATKYEVYNSAGHDMTLTLQVTSGSTSGLIYKKICQSTSGDTVISTVVPSSGRITIANFGDSDCENLILAVVNSVYTNSVISYSITPSLS